MSRVETTIKNSTDEIARVPALVEQLALAQALPASSVWSLNVEKQLAQEQERTRMDVHESVVHGVTVIEVAGRIDSITAPDFETRLASALESTQRHLVLDLGQLLFISSAGFRVLYRAVMQANEKNGKLVLCSMSASVSELFAIAGFSKLFTIVGSREDGVVAVAS